MEHAQRVARDPLVAEQPLIGAELLPLFRLVKGLEELDVEVLRLLRHAGRPVDRALHVVLDVVTELLGGRHVGERRHAGVGELHDRAALAGAPELHLLGRVVDRGIDVLADQILGHGAAALERDVGDVVAVGGLHHRGQD
jgi:hypothetical protein